MGGPQDGGRAHRCPHRAHRTIGSESRQDGVAAGRCRSGGRHGGIATALRALSRTGNSGARQHPARRRGTLCGRLWPHRQRHDRPHATADGFRRHDEGVVQRCAARRRLVLFRHRRPLYLVGTQWWRPLREPFQPPCVPLCGGRLSEECRRFSRLANPVHHQSSAHAHRLPSDGLV